MGQFCITLTCFVYDKTTDELVNLTYILHLVYKYKLIVLYILYTKLMTFTGQITLPWMTRRLLKLCPMKCDLNNCMFSAHN